MEENRSFDHMFGYYPGVNGVKGDETNPYDTFHPEGRVAHIDNKSPYVSPFDPDHSTGPTTDKIFGKAGVASGSTTPKMDGFVEFEAQRGSPEPETVMNMFTPDRLPVMSALASEFAVFDRFFCSHPGPTWPNRLFQLLGSSNGCTKTSNWDPKTLLYRGRTVFDIVEEAGLDWRYYYADAPLELAMIWKIALNVEKVKPWDRFLDDIAQGQLPAFSWVNPRWFVNVTSREPASDQHPDHDVRAGEALFKTVYEALRAGPQWNETLFIITYDEHGGFYDHVPTPMGVPAPDAYPSHPDKNFSFTRLGIRIPTLLISPWVPKGTIISAPSPAQKPQNNSEFDLTSIISTVKNLLASPGKHLTKRDEWAATFDDVFTESTPRTDCPMKLPPAPSGLRDPENIAREAALPLNDLQVDIANAFRTMRGLSDESVLPETQGEGSEWIARVAEDIMQGQHVFADAVAEAKQANV